MKRLALEQPRPGHAQEPRTYKLLWAFHPGWTATVKVVPKRECRLS